MGKTVKNWLAKQSRPWLMVLDHLVMEEDNGAEASTKLQVGDMVEMLTCLSHTRNGRIIITTRQIPQQWPETPDETLAVATSMQSALQIIDKHLPRKRICLDEDWAARQLCKRLGCLPLGISIACDQIKDSNTTIESYVKTWLRSSLSRLLSYKLSSTSSPSLSHEFEMSYESLKRRNANTEVLRPVDLLNLLACLDGYNISEAIFERAWNYMTPESPQEEYDWSISSIVKRVFQFVQGTTQQRLDEAEQHRPKFLSREPEDNDWSDSAARIHLHVALKELRDCSFVLRTRAKNEGNITLSPLFREWIRLQPREMLQNSWWQASFIMMASLRPVTEAEDRESSGFGTFQRRAAANIEQLRDLSDRWDLKASRRNDSRGTSTSESSWTQNVLELDKSGRAAVLFADALSLHGYSDAAMQLRKAHDHLVEDETGSIEKVASQLTYANSCAQHGDHPQALQLRQAALESLEALPIPGALTGKPLDPIAPSRAKQLLKVDVRLDITDSLWHLGRKPESLKILKSQLEILRDFRRFLDSDSSKGLRFNKMLNSFMMELRIRGAKYLGRHKQHLEEAREVIKLVLEDFAISPQSNLEFRNRRLRAAAVNADITHSLGKHREACTERRRIARELKKDDQEMMRLETLEAQYAYANSLSYLGHHTLSLRERKEIESRLRRQGSLNSLDHEFEYLSQQSLVKCYLDVAGHLFGGNNRSDPQGQDCVRLALNLSRETWKSLWRHKGHTHIATLESLALMIKCERESDVFATENTLGGIDIDSAFNETERRMGQISEQDTDTQNAWFRVQLQNSLVSQPSDRLSRLKLLQEHLHCNSGDENRLELRYYIACAVMEPLYGTGGKERYRMQKNAEFKDAAEQLEMVWTERSALFSPNSHDALVSLGSAAKAYRAIGSRRFLDLQKRLVTLYAATLGEDSPKAADALRELNVGRKKATMSATSWEELRDQNTTQSI